MVEAEVTRLLTAVDVQEIRGTTPREIRSIQYDSRQVGSGDLYVALRGTRTDGHRYILDAFAAGAAAVFVEEIPGDCPGPAIRVADTLASLPHLAAAFYGTPGDQLTLAAITGSNGKTSSTYMIEAMWHAAGEAAAVIGTIEYRWKGRTLKAPNTTPLALDLQRILADIRDDSVMNVVMEVSSHALRLHRVNGLKFHTATFTNLSPEHLDFHKDIDDYREAKAALFTENLHPDGKAVINTDDEHGRIIFERIPEKQRVSFGLSESVDVTAEEHSLALNGTSFTLRTPDWEREIRSPLLGEHNLRNLIGAGATGYALGLAPDHIVTGLQNVRRIPGRLEPIENNKGAQILVDYAHTPDGLQQVLSTLAALPHRRLVTVFGCGGDRDRTKRPVMGDITLKYSDRAIVTSDNPRTEDPIEIIREIERGMVAGRDRYEIEPDRREAIHQAVDLVGENDILLIAGKGHETTQTIGTTAYPFDDRIVVREFLQQESHTREGAQ